ncbi:MAG: DNA double-strand break repair nuclease NurA [Candidatus Methanomethyliaceae archaeon]|nr:DNA double-strand break repair nuclease NurA [Candidatus Methanomethyliaceae archaeon]MDW7970758.1 DNA double-strand break repair nuclease NurA [Nitrososphaerota archaeon]
MSKEILDSIKSLLNFPERTKAYGFDEWLDVNSIMEIGEKEGKISAIDGGTSEIIRFPTMALVLNRIYCNCFLGMKKLDYFSRCTFISLTRLIKEGDKLIYETKILNFLEGYFDLKIPKVDSNAIEMRIGRNRGDITRALSMARRFAEWAYVEKALESGAKLILIDGSLQASFPNESKLMDSAYELVRNRNAIIAGLSKTTTLFTEEGIPISGFLEHLASKRGLRKWAIRLGISNEWTHRAIVYYLKLHENADRGFRMDILKDVGEIEEAFSMLASNSKYFAFPGYPYALIDAHEYAKVGREEAMHIKGLILDSLNKEESKKMEEFEASLTGHRILDELG